MEYDTTSLEIQLLREALGPDGERFLLRALRMQGFTSAADLDALALGLQRYFEL